MALKKKIFEIEIPLLGSSTNAGAINIQELDNRTVKIDLTRQLRGKSMEAVFVVSVRDNKAYAHCIGMTLLPFYIRRAMRKGISYVEDSFVCHTKDNVLRVKPFLITRREVYRSIRKSLRNNCREFIMAFCSDKGSEEVFDALISGGLQRELSMKLKKIYPLSFCEIRVCKFEKAGIKRSEAEGEKKQ